MYFSSGSYFGGFLLCNHARVFELGAVAPDGGFLLTHECNIAARGGRGA